MLGVKRILRVGTCGGLQPDMQLGDLIVALTAVPADATARHLIGNEPHVPTADWDLVHGAVHAAKELGKPVRVGPIVSSDVFYNPDEGQYQRWSERGVLAVEMEAAMLFTLGALRKIEDRVPADRQRRGRRGRVRPDLGRGDARRGRPDDRARARDRHRGRAALAPPGPSSSSIRPPQAARPGAAGPSSPAAPPRSG